MKMGYSLLIEFSITHHKAPFALSLSKGLSGWAQGRFGKLRTCFDKALLSEVDGLDRTLGLRQAQAERWSGDVRVFPANTGPEYGITG